MTKIFISYKRLDKDKVFPIVREIKNNTGIDCWIDLEGIESGDQFQNVIISAIDNSDIVIFMLTKNFIAPYKDVKTGRIDLTKQTFPEKEVMYALRHNKRLIPISIDGTYVHDCKWLDFNCSGLDCIDWNIEESKQKLLNNLTRWDKTKIDDSLIEFNHNTKKRIILKYLTHICKSFFFRKNDAVANGKNAKKIFTIVIITGVVVSCYFSKSIIIKDDSRNNTKISIENKHHLQNVKEIVPCQYDYAEEFSEGLACVMKNGKFGFIDENGKYVIQPVYENATSFSEGLACVKRYGLFGYIDKKGNTTIPFEFDDAKSFSEGFATVEMNGKWGYIDTAGKIMIPCIYHSAKAFSNDRAIVEISDKLLNWEYDIIDKTGNIISSQHYYLISNYSEGLAPVQITKHGKWGYIDKSGEIVIQCQYDEAFGFNLGLARVRIGTKLGFIDKSGAIIIPCQYTNLGNFSEGLSVAEKEGKYGFIDREGTTIIPFKYEYANSFSEGLAYVIQTGKCTFINKTGKEEIFMTKHDFVGEFSGGLTYVGVDNKIGFINRKGKVVLPFEYDYVTNVSKRISLVKKNKKYGYIKIYNSGE